MSGAVHPQTLMLQLGTKRGAARKDLRTDQERSPSHHRLLALWSTLPSQLQRASAGVGGELVKRAGEVTATAGHENEALFFSKALCGFSPHGVLFTGSHVKHPQHWVVKLGRTVMAPLPPLVHLSLPGNHGSPSASGPLSSVLGWLAGIQWVGRIWPLERLQLCL